MTSQDVIHGLWIPALRVKKDVVPGRYTSMWFQADNVGTYDLLCTQYCGDDHSNMLARSWCKPPRTTTPGSRTRPTISKRCRRPRRARCCTTSRLFAVPLDRRNRRHGPFVQGHLRNKTKLSDGSSVLVDDNYIRESILDPQAKIVAGFQPVMSTYKGLVSDDDITALIEFIKSLSPKSSHPPRGESHAKSPK